MVTNLSFSLTHPSSQPQTTSPQTTNWERVALALFIRSDHSHFNAPLLVYFMNQLVLNITIDVQGRTGEGQDIAVKLLSRNSGQGLLEFKNELILISELQHVNLVKLIGFCIHKDDKMIIYDYMPNKSLDCFLFSKFLILISIIK